MSASNSCQSSDWALITVSFLWRAHQIQDHVIPGFPFIIDEPLMVCLSLRLINERKKPGSHLLAIEFFFSLLWAHCLFFYYWMCPKVKRKKTHMPRGFLDLIFTSAPNIIKIKRKENGSGEDELIKESIPDMMLKERSSRQHHLWKEKKPMLACESFSFNRQESFSFILTFILLAIIKRKETWGQHWGWTLTVMKEKPLGIWIHFFHKRELRF